MSERKTCFLRDWFIENLTQKVKKNQILSEEETPVEESWVHEEFAPEFVTNIINMREFNHYNEVPQDIKIWIGEHKIRRLRYLPHREKILD